MLLRSKVAPALLAASLLIAGCGGSDSGSNSIPIVPIIPSKTVAFNSLPKGSFSLDLTRTGATNIPGDENIYIQILSQPCKNSSPCAKGDTTQVTYVSIDPTTAVTGGPNGEASLGKINVASPNQPLPAFKLNSLVNSNIILPGDGVYAGSRIYISMGAELKMITNPEASGYSQTNFDSSTDPNIGIPFDFVEFAYDAKPKAIDPKQNTVAWGGNLSQVDQFGIPLAFKLTGVAGTIYNRGITLGSLSSSGANSRDAIIQNYLNTVSVPFQALAQTVNGKVIRILAPYHSANFKPGGANATFFDSYVNDVWTYFQNNPSTIYDQPNNEGNKYVVSSNGTTLSVTRNGLGPYTMQKPSTYDVFTNAGNLLPGGGDINAFGAMLAGALNRHVATQTTAWLTPSQFYLASPKHDYAQFWHQISIEKLAYGFGFDDTANQSSVAILSPTEDISSLNVTIGW